MSSSTTKIIATFALILLTIGCVYVMTATEDDDFYTLPGGTIEGDSDYDRGDKVTLVAEPIYGYHFVGWYDGSNMVSSSPTYTFTAVNSNKLTPKFEPSSFYVSITSNYDGGTEYGHGSYLYGSSATLTAEVKDGYNFAGWYDNGKKISSNTYTNYKVERDSAIRAEYSIIHDPSFTVIRSSVTAPTTLIFDSKYDVEIQSRSWTVTDSITDDILFSSASRVNDKIVLNVDSGKALSIVQTVTYTDGTTSFAHSEEIVDQIVKKTFPWKYQKDSWYSILTSGFLNNADAKWDLPLSFKWYYNYMSDDIPRGGMGAFISISEYVTDEDWFIISMARGMNDFTSEMNDLQRVNCVLKFVQSIEYQYDIDGKGQNEYWKYPAETLWDMKGDCEDHAFLFASLIKAMGYEVVIIDMPSHIAAGVKVNGASGIYVTHNGEKYYYCEATADSGTGKSNWANVGYMPSGYSVTGIYKV